MRSISRYIVMLLVVGLTYEGQAQHTIDEDPLVRQMMERFAERNKSRETVKAWRIQTAALSDRRSMENEKIRFENLFPHLRLEWIHDNPYYILKIRDAAYRDKVDALYLLHRIKRRYPSAILVLDDVKPEDLLNSRRL